jgi:cytochrome c2
VIRILLYGTILLSMLACSEKQSAGELTTVQKFMADPAALARGQAIFEGSCANFCHNLEVEQSIDAAFLFDCEWNHGSSDEEIFNTVTNGITGTRMVGFGSNFPQEDDLWKVIAYLRSRQQAC